MGIGAAGDQGGGDAVLAVRVQEMQDSEPTVVRQLAERWEGGLRALLGLAGISGLVGAPLAAGNLSRLARILVGTGLGLVLLLAVAGLLASMTAAHGSTRRRPRPAGQTGYQRLRLDLAERDRRYLLLGRSLAVAALTLLAMTVVVAWIDPRSEQSFRIRVSTTDGSVRCATQIIAADGHLVLLTPAGGITVLPTDIQTIDTGPDCGKP